VTYLYLKLILPVIIIFLALSIGTRALGATQPPNPALGPFSEGCEGKPQPCWLGVVPGLTTEAETRKLLAFAGGPTRRGIVTGGFKLVFTLPQPLSYCYAAFDFVDGVVNRGELSLCHQSTIRVGDLAVLMGGDHQVVSLPPEQLIYGRLSMTIDGWLSPYNRVTYIAMFSPGMKFQTYPWHGFVLRHRYCQLVPNYPPCRKSL
jgi:hypothetical protein